MPPPSHRRPFALLLAISCSAGCRRATAQHAAPHAPDPTLSQRCAPGQLGSARMLLPIPASVTPTPSDPNALHAEAVGWRAPGGVRFVVAAPERRGREVILRGALENNARVARRVLLVEAGVGPFHATLTGEGLPRRGFAAPASPGVTPPPALLPEPRAFVLAPGARWPFALTLPLDCWQLEGYRSVNLRWWFSLAGDGAHGDVAIALP